MAKVLFRASFENDAQVLTPLPFAQSGWGPTMRGAAVSAALVRQAETAAHAEDAEGMTPARWTLELLKPAGMVPSVVSASTLRWGRRSGVIDVEMRQEGKLVARASALYLRTSQAPREHAWTGDYALAPPPPGAIDSDPDRRMYGTFDRGWVEDRTTLQGAYRRQAWCGGISIVENEEPTPFQAVATVSDVASIVTHWASEGLQYINPDLTLYLSRAPEGDEFGMLAIDREANHGIAVGTAALWDRAGRLGTITTSALATDVIVDIGGWHPNTGGAEQ